MKSLVLFCLCLILSSGLSAQLKSPAEFLPHPYTKAFTPHHLLVDYFYHVAANSPMVRLEEIGRTYEHRPMLLAYVSSEANLANIENIRQQNLAMAGMSESHPGISHARTVVWLSFSIHGNEASGAEASMQVLYDLVTNQNNASAWLENTVVIMEPCANPDGFNRFAEWNTQVSSTTFIPEKASRERDEPWPGGRVNHYLFDLNRDWAWQTQIESQNRGIHLKRWLPHVVADIHEMHFSSPYFFAPAAQPFHDFITDWQSEFQVTIGKNHARYFDRYGWAYYTKEFFDLFYPSYGDTYTTYHGAIGMTYEQGGQALAGRAIPLHAGDTLTLADRIEHHKTAALSTIEATAQNASDVLHQFRQYFAQSRENPPGQYKTYVVRGNSDKGKLRSLCAFLDRQGIRYGTTQTFTAKEAYAYQSDKSVTVSVDASDLIIPAHQPLAVLTQVLFDPESTLVDSATYDITAWSLPHAYGVETYALREKVEIKEGYSFAPASIPSASDQYAYAVRWNSLQDAKFVAAALDAGFLGRFASHPFQATSGAFEAGTVIFLRADNRNKDGFPQKLFALGQELEVDVFPIASGFSAQGKDLGSSAYTLLEAPHVLTIAGENVQANEFGQVWHFFEQVLQYPLTVVNHDQLGSVSWDDYDVLVLPEGYYSISDHLMDEIKSWVIRGGKVIAIGSALSHFRDRDGFALKKYAEETKAEEVRKAEEQARLNMRLETYESSERRDLSSYIFGAVFKAKVDETHPLGFGLGENYFTLKTDATSYEHLVDASNVVYLESDLQHFGFAGAKALEHQKNSIVFAVEKKGSGSIVYLVDNPLFRGFWQNGQLVFCNALFFAGN